MGRETGQSIGHEWDELESNCGRKLHPLKETATVIWYAGTTTSNFGVHAKACYVESLDVA